MGCIKTGVKQEGAAITAQEAPTPFQHPQNEIIVQGVSSADAGFFIVPSGGDIYK